jgi:hypothetical protein
MRKKFPGMHARIRTPAASGLNRFTQNSGQRFVQSFLYRYRIGLHLPAMKAGTIVSQLNKVALFFGHGAKLNFDLRFEN